MVMKLKCRILLIFLLFFSLLFTEENDKGHKIWIEVNINCPMSEELNALLETIPSPDTPAVTEDYEEWAESFEKVMTKVIELIKSKKVGNTSLSISHTFEDEEVLTIDE